MDYMFDFWHWWILAAFLMGVEIFAPGAFMIWIGLAAGLVGLIAMIFPMLGLPIELLLFAVFSVIFAVAGRKYVKTRQQPTDHPHLNVRAAQYVGKSVVVIKAIENGKGKVRVGDTEWLAMGPDAAEGETVKIIGAKGTALEVEKET